MRSDKHPPGALLKVTCKSQRGLNHTLLGPTPGGCQCFWSRVHTLRTRTLLHPPTALISSHMCSKARTHSDICDQTQGPASSSAPLGPILLPRSLGSNLSRLLCILQAVLLLPQEGKEVGEERIEVERQGCGERQECGEWQEMLLARWFPLRVEKEM